MLLRLPKVLVILAFAALLLAPFAFAVAQSYDDDRPFRRYGLSSEAQKRINALDDKPVAALPIPGPAPPFRVSPASKLENLPKTLGAPRDAGAPPQGGHKSFS